MYKATSVAFPLGVTHTRHVGYWAIEARRMCSPRQHSLLPSLVIRCQHAVHLVDDGRPDADGFLVDIHAATPANCPCTIACFCSSVRVLV